MFWAWDITITAGTTEATPYTKKLKVSKGVITYIGIFFPPGCHGLVKVRLLHNEFQLIPLSRGEWVTGNGMEVQSERHYELFHKDFALKFQGCSPTCSWNHTVTVRVTVVPEIVASLAPLINLFRQIIGA